MDSKKETKQMVITRIVKKIAVATIIGLGVFFGGVFCAIISPLIAILSLIYTPPNNVSQKLKSFEETFKELQDPDYKEKWKKDHDNLYNPNDNPENN